MKHLYLYLIFMFILFSCKNTNNKKNELYKTIQEYSKKYNKNTVFFSRGAASKEDLYKDVTYPSYSVYFDKINNDTIMQIGFFPYFYNIFPINNDTIEEFEIFKTDGFTILDNNVYFFFNASKYYKELDTSKLIKKIPDSLKYDPFKKKYRYGNFNPNIVKFKLKNGKFIKF